MKNKVLWGLQALAAIVFLAAGGVKFVGVQQMVDVFNLIGIGQWFRYVTAAFEVVGAIALLTPRFSGFGAALLAWVMFCAMITHLIVLPGSPIPSIILLAITAYVASQRLPAQFAKLQLQLKT
jgi:putative oxidoreductase